MARGMNTNRAWFLATLFASSACGPLELDGAIDEPPAEESLISTAAALTPSSWMLLPNAISLASPAVATLGTSLHLLAVSNTGSLKVSTTETAAGGWAAWSDVAGGRPAATSLATDTAPVAAVDGTTLYVFARGADNNLYRASKTDGGAFTSWTQLTSSGRVRGPISVAVHRQISATKLVNVLVTHALFTSGASTVDYHRFEGSALVTSSSFSSVTGGSIALSPSGEVWAALHGVSSVSVYRIVTKSTTWGWSLVGSRSASGGRVYDLSNLTWFAGGFHFAYSVKQVLFPDYNPIYQLRHARFVPGRGDDGFSRLITSFAPSQDPDQAGLTLLGRLFPQASLAVYRNKLVAAFRMHDATVRYARLDSADPSLPWIGNAAVGTLYAYFRPVLAAFDGRGAVTDYSAVGYGNDLFAAATSVWTANVYATDFSRTVFKQDIGAQFTLWNDTGVADDECGPVTATSASVSSEDRPVATELGFALWMLPHWFDRTLFAAQAQFYCANEPYRTSWIGSGRVSDPCSSAKMPVIVKTTPGIYFCRGIWIGDNNSAIRIFEELGHYASQAMGIGDDSPAPGSVNATRTGIALSALNTAFDLYNEGRSSCDRSVPRCTGFTGIASNYDATSREHSFLYVVYYYLLDGAQLRSWVDEDLDAGSDLLQRKYNWVKTNLFRGVEFNQNSEPMSAL